MTYGKIMKQLKSFNFTNAQRKKLASIILKLDEEKQDILISGDNIATINGQSLLNGGNISLIKTGIFTIVTELPTNNIDKDKVYLVPSTETDDENKFSEYIYTDNDWEKLGTFTAKIDLSNYVQKTDVVTDTTNGLMLASDKVKLDAFKEADKYSRAIYLPYSVISTANISSNETSITLEYTKDGLIYGGNSKVNLQIRAATTSAAGVMSAADKKKMNNIPYEIVTYIGVTHNDSSYVDIRCDKITTGGTYLSSILRIVSATQSIAGVMSASDKVKLDGIEAGAQVNTIESVSVNGTPLEVTNRGVDIPIHEYTAGDGIKLENGKFSLDTIEHTERSYTTELIGPKEEPALNIPIVDESGKLNKNILIPNVADLSNRTPTEWTGEIDDLGCIRYEDYKNISDYYYNFTKNIFFYPIQDNQLLMYNIGKGIDDDKLSDFLKNPDNYDNWNIPVAIYLSDGLLASGGLYGEVPVYDPNDDSKVYYPGGVFGFKVNIDKSENNLLTFTEGEDYTDGFSPSIVNTKKLIVPKQSVIDTIVNSNEFNAKQDALTEAQLNNINNAITSISVNDVEQVNTNGTVNLTIPNATTEKDGMMSKADKTKLDSLENYTLPAATSTTLGGVEVPVYAGVNENQIHVNHGGEIQTSLNLIYNSINKTLTLKDFITNKIIDSIDCTKLIKDGPNASITENGLMPKEDKAKLDSQPTIKANDATGVTDDDYVVIKKSELNSILSRLSALENKA